MPLFNSIVASLATFVKSDLPAAIFAASLASAIRLATGTVVDCNLVVFEGAPYRPTGWLGRPFAASCSAAATGGTYVVVTGERSGPTDLASAGVSGYGHCRQYPARSCKQDAKRSPGTGPLPCLAGAGVGSHLTAGNIDEHEQYWPNLRAPSIKI